MKKNRVRKSRDAASLIMKHFPSFQVENLNTGTSVCIPVVLLIYLLELFLDLEGTYLQHLPCPPETSHHMYPVPPPPPPQYVTLFPIG